MFFIVLVPNSSNRYTPNSEKDTSFNGPAWSPDGTKLLYLHSLPNGGEICIMNADGSAQTKLMDAYGFGDSPVWQP